MVMGLGSILTVLLSTTRASAAFSQTLAKAKVFPAALATQKITTKSKALPCLIRIEKFPSQFFSPFRPKPPSKLPIQKRLKSSATSTPSSSPSATNRTQRKTTANTNKMTTPTLWAQGKSSAISQCILPLSFESHKGASGRIGVLGGSAQYTGAPYYAAMASLQAGGDLAYVFCAEEATLPIKSYSPELMVAPVYSASGFDAMAETYQENSDIKKKLVEKMVKEVTFKLERLHTLVIGPGMGRCPLVCEATAQIIQYAKEKKLAMVLDADALWMLAQPEYRGLFEGYDESPVVLTPNVVEYKRLKDSLSEAQLRSTTIVRKGKHDVIIQNGKEVMECHEVGGKKRSGGIGDVLAGTIGTLLAWNRILKTDEEDSLALACWTACCFVKHATLLAFNSKKRSMTAPDVLQHLGPAINEMTDEEEVCPPMANL